uniref:YhfC family intramembrane metalloprotease n=1 Tax=uncultured marine thaumarchaeote AD1000_24_H07 TaxID=1455902 RepID=A0A075FSJ2_9ARCH|nr:hypothetical protein [uncultured marine thaumarchaeote AD1000_24_H07]
MGPFLLFTFRFVGKDKDYWRSFFFGGVGWVTALTVRYVPVHIPLIIFPIRLAVNTFSTTIYYAYTALAAAIFETGFRYLFLRRSKNSYLEKNSSFNSKHVFTFGIGWGVGEALIVYSLPMIIILLFSSDPLSSSIIFLGSLERNFAIISHLSLTLIVSSSFVRGKKFLVLATILHFILDFVPIMTLSITENFWITELLLALISIIMILSVYLTRSHSLNFD